MVQVDVPMAIAVGSFVADAARTQLQRGERRFYYEALAKNNLCQIFLFSWVYIYMIMNYFGWETTYRWWTQDSVESYSFFVPVFILVLFAASNLGFLIGNHLVRSDRLNANRAIYIGIVIFSVIWIVSQMNRVLRVGTYSQWSQGKAAWFYQDRMFCWVVAFAVLLEGIGMFLLYRSLRNEGQRVASE
jgi:hypothetical protein